MPLNNASLILDGAGTAGEAFGQEMEKQKPLSPIQKYLSAYMSGQMSLQEATARAKIESQGNAPQPQAQPQPQGNQSATPGAPMAAAPQTPRPEAQYQSPGDRTAERQPVDANSALGYTNKPMSFQPPQLGLNSPPSRHSSPDASPQQAMQQAQAASMNAQQPQGLNTPSVAAPTPQSRPSRPPMPEMPMPQNQEEYSQLMGGYPMFAAQQKNENGLEKVLMASLARQNLQTQKDNAAGQRQKDKFGYVNDLIDRKGGIQAGLQKARFAAMDDRDKQKYAAQMELAKEYDRTKEGMARLQAKTSTDNNNARITSNEGIASKNRDSKEANLAMDKIQTRVQQLEASKAKLLTSIQNSSALTNGVVSPDMAAGLKWVEDQLTDAHKQYLALANKRLERVFGQPDSPAAPAASASPPPALIWPGQSASKGGANEEASESPNLLDDASGEEN